MWSSLGYGQGFDPGSDGCLFAHDAKWVCTRQLTCPLDGQPSKGRLPEGIRHEEVTKGATAVVMDASRCSSLGYVQGRHPGPDVFFGTE